MTPWLGRLGFGEAPTRAIVFVSWMICSGVLMTGAILPAHVRHAACRLRPAYEPGRQGGESREGGAVGGSWGGHRGRHRRPPREMECDRQLRGAPCRGRETGGRRVGRGHG